MSLAKNWCFTLNNYSDNEVDVLRELFNSSTVNYALFQREVGKEGTPHLQGYISFESRKRLTAIKKLVGDRANLRVAKGTALQNRDYCSKEETAVPGSLEEFGEVPEEKSGKRSDLEDFKEAVKGGCISLKRLREDYSEVIAKYPRFVKEYIRDYTPDRSIPDDLKFQWQRDLFKFLEDTPPDGRTIHFVVDLVGNKGKTHFSEYYRQKHSEDTIVVSPGPKADMVYSAYSCGILPRVLILDAPRSKQATIQYDFLEEMVNGSIDVKKYESFQWRFNPPHVVCMMNRMPKLVDDHGEDVLSDDRVHVIHI